jgi:hypothetical protein
MASPAPGGSQPSSNITNILTAIQSLKGPNGEQYSNQQLAALLQQSMPQLGELAKQGKLNAQQIMQVCEQPFVELLEQLGLSLTFSRPLNHNLSLSSYNMVTLFLTIVLWETFSSFPWRILSSKSTRSGPKPPINPQRPRCANRSSIPHPRSTSLIPMFCAL